MSGRGPRPALVKAPAPALVCVLAPAGCSSGHAAPHHALVKAYIARGSDAATVKRVRFELRQEPHVIAVRYVSPAAQLRKLSAADRADANLLGSNPLPPRFDVVVDSPGAVRSVARVAERIPEVAACQSMPCVTYGRLVRKAT
jgi:cell division protein FtsX